MPGQSVLTSLVEIRSASPSTRIVVLTMHENTTLARQLLLRGASAYLIKTIGHHELVAAVRATTERAAGHGDPVGLPRRAGRARGGRRSGAVRPGAGGAVPGLPCPDATPAIATELRITEGTVKRHLSNINAKLGVDLAAGRRPPGHPRPAARPRGCWTTSGGGGRPSASATAAGSRTQTVKAFSVSPSGSRCRTLTRCRPGHQPPRRAGFGQPGRRPARRPPRTPAPAGRR